MPFSSRDPSSYRGLEMESPRGGGASHAEFLDDRFILPPPQELVIEHGLSTIPRHVRLGMIIIDKILTYIGSCDSIDPSRHTAFRPQIRP